MIAEANQMRHALPPGVIHLHTDYAYRTLLNPKHLKYLIEEKYLYLLYAS